MYQFSYNAVADLNQSLLERLGRCPRQPDLLCYVARTIWGVLCRTWLKVYHRLVVVGRENLPASGSFVIVANHSSHLDTLCLQAALPLRKLHHTYPAAATDYFFKSAPRVAFSAICINAMPFNRADHVRQGMGVCRRILADPNNVLIVFPEGTRSTDGQVGSFRRGIGELVAGRKVPVVPCHIEGAFDAMPKGRRFPWPCKLTLRIGKPMTFEDREPGKSGANETSNDLREAVIALGRCNHDNTSGRKGRRVPVAIADRRKHIPILGRRGTVLSRLAWRRAGRKGHPAFSSWPRALGAMAGYC